MLSYFAYGLSYVVRLRSVPLPLLFKTFFFWELPSRLEAISCFMLLKILPKMPKAAPLKCIVLSLSWDQNALERIQRGYKKSGLISRNLSLKQACVQKCKDVEADNRYIHTAKMRIQVVWCNSLILQFKHCFWVDTGSLDFSLTRLKTRKTKCLLLV